MDGLHCLLLVLLIMATGSTIYYRLAYIRKHKLYCLYKQYYDEMYNSYIDFLNDIINDKH